MPFTLSHAAAVLPLMRRRSGCTGAARGPLVASALVAGALAPDMTYYADSVVPGGMEFGTFTHSLSGVLTVDVLVTVALVAGWLLVREPVLALLPAARRGRVSAWVRGRPWRPRGVRELAALAARFAVSAVLGSATHVVWDSFTHVGRWGARLVPGLDGVVGGVPAATYVQYGTSAVAMAAMGWFVWSALRGGGLGGVDGANGRERGEHGRADAGEGEGEGDGVVGAAGGTGAGPSLAVGVRLLLSVPLVLGVLLGAAHRTVRAYAEYGGAAGWFDYVPTVLFGAGAGLCAGLVLYGTGVRLLVWRAGRSRPAPGTVRGAQARAEADAAGATGRRGTGVEATAAGAAGAGADARGDVAPGTAAGASEVSPTAD
ncbi:hypothetical protein SSP35_07_01550 [Streptomyces sp. NBRC 110611]|uniref:DUF4184 family protein n=1 Tax=Streptomyces sp. NBRC 110611 TaxID=1621259 RepID=UPI000836FCD5|nr:DUF4184 family protein [Streptomyces sp. NBRC 110611]GAU68353.1 hypothetical protein SSP35_07_01550 [Streptomyces sp. NBRC 110611]